MIVIDSQARLAAFAVFWFLVGIAFGIFVIAP